MEENIMTKMPVNEGQEKVAAFPFDLQLFADGGDADVGGSANIGDTGVDDSSDVDVNTNIDASTNASVNDDVNVDDSEIVDRNDDADVPEPVKKQSPEANKAFAEMRRKAELAERKVQAEKARRDADISKRFGHMNIHTEEQYWEAVDRQNEIDAQRAREAQAQELLDKGYDPLIVQMMQEQENLKSELIARDKRDAERAKQEQVEKGTQAIMADHTKLRTEFGDAVPDLQNVDDKTIALLQKGYSFYDAWTCANRDAVIEHAKTSGQKKALKNVNSKAHLQSEKSGTGDFGTEVVLSAEQLRVWKAMGYSEKEARKRARKYVKQGK